jgi:phenylalanyl-tRNA synthetase beta chain
MRVPFRWLQEFVKIDVTPEEVCNYLIMLGFSDAAVLPNEWDMLDNFVAGRATRIEEHPTDRHLKVVSVNLGYTDLVSVCGAPNMETGGMYIVALPGAKLAGGQVVDASPVAGVHSQCILCSGWEAWLDDSKHELLSLDKEIAPGTKLTDALKLDEPVIEMEVTPNRGDCLGLIGVARELAAVFGKELNIPEPALNENGRGIGGIVSVEVVDKKGCPRYGAIVCEGVEVRGSTAETRVRLRLAGLRPVNNIVDVTNLVLFETGHPLHAFDLDKVDGSRVIVRRAAANEKIIGIDGKEYALSGDDLVIADAQKPIAIAGVIGSENSEVTASTRRVLLEGAFFDRSSVWRTSKRLGVTSEASYRFARGADIGAVLYVLARAADMIQQDTTCEVSQGMIDVYPEPAAPEHVLAGPKRINKLLGTSIPEQEICDYLERLGFLVSPGKELEVVVPTRRRDVKGEADIAEEVARLYGYDRIGERASLSCGCYGRIPRRSEVVNEVKNALVGMGVTEVITDSMLGPKRLESFGLSPEETVEIRNPVGVESSFLRPTLLPGVLTVLVKNENWGEPGVAVFELGEVFLKDKTGFREVVRLAVGLSGARHGRTWYAKAEDLDFYDVKGIIETIGEFLGLSLRFADGEHAMLHPGRRAVILLGEGEQAMRVGYLGEVDPSVCEALGSRRRMCVAEVDFDDFLASAADLKRFQGIQKYPSVKRDLAVIVADNIRESRVRDVILAHGASLIESVDIFDVYRGEQIPSGTKSLAYGIVFRSDSRTLTETEVDEVQKRIEKILIDEFNATIRMKAQ